MGKVLGRLEIIRPGDRKPEDGGPVTLGAHVESAFFLGLDAVHLPRYTDESPKRTEIANERED